MDGPDSTRGEEPAHGLGEMLACQLRASLPESALTEFGRHLACAWNDSEAGRKLVLQSDRVDVKESYPARLKAAVARLTKSVNWLVPQLGLVSTSSECDPRLHVPENRDRLAMHVVMARHELTGDDPSRSVRHMREATEILDKLWRRFGFDGRPTDHAGSTCQIEALEATVDEAPEVTVRAALAAPAFGHAAAGALNSVLAAEVTARFPVESRAWPLLRTWRFWTAVSGRGVVAVVMHDQVRGLVSGPLSAVEIPDPPLPEFNVNTIEEWLAYLRTEHGVRDDGAVFAMPLRTAVDRQSEILRRWQQDAELLAPQIEGAIRRHMRILGFSARGQITGQNVLSRTGSGWTVRYDGRLVSTGNLKGMEYLATLLARPQEDVSCLDLSGRPRAAPGERIMDGNYREELKKEIEDAVELGHEERAAELQAIYQSAAGFQGHPRRMGDESERARKAVGAALTRAIAKLAKGNPGLGHHLSTCVRNPRGRSVSYRPPSDAVPWLIEA